VLRADRARNKTNFIKVGYMIALAQLKAGSVVKVRSEFGHGPVVTGVVSEVFEEIKNGKPGITYESTGLNEQDRPCWHWAYLDQVLEVLP
jgi:hypothetical protein